MVDFSKENAKMLRYEHKYDDSREVKKDEQRAFECYKKSAETGNADAMYDLGLCYHKGMGVDKDGTKAVEWFKKAAEAGTHK